MKKNKRILVLFGILLSAYLFLYAHEFEIQTRTDFWVILTEFVISIVLVILILLIKAEWWVKFFGFVALMAFLFILLPKSGLWQYSLNKYVNKNGSEYIKFANEISKIGDERLTYVSCFNGSVNSRPRLDSIENDLFKKSICNYIEDLDCVEVCLDKSKGKFLFVMSRFIDNGYGLLYCESNLEIEQIVNERINGLEITGVVKAQDGWYCVSFT